jgi:hypothetical protein
VEASGSLSTIIPYSALVDCPLAFGNIGANILQVNDAISNPRKGPVKNTIKEVFNDPPKEARALEALTYSEAQLS